MQKWEYRRCQVNLVQREIATGERGVFDGERKEIKWVWLIDSELLEEGLASLGEDGWEMVGSAVQGANPYYWLYFKRPKP